MTDRSASFCARYEKTFARWAAFQSTKLYDSLMALPIILWYGASAGEIAPAIGGEIAHAEAHGFDFHAVISILARVGGLGLVITAFTFLALRRPARLKSKGLMPRVTAIMGTFLSVLIVWLPPHPMGTALSLISLFLMLGGTGFSIFSLLHLGRSFSMMPEARHLVTDGPYAKIRHPLYVGEFVATLGLMVQFLSPTAALIMVLVFFLQLQRMKNEELVLSTMFPEYRDYSVGTARLVPGLY